MTIVQTDFLFCFILNDWIIFLNKTLLVFHLNKSEKNQFHLSQEYLKKKLDLHKLFLQEFKWETQRLLEDSWR